MGRLDRKVALISGGARGQGATEAGRVVDLHFSSHVCHTGVLS
jgi:hypothetical protein